MEEIQQTQTKCGTMSARIHQVSGMCSSECLATLSVSFHVAQFVSSFYSFFTQSNTGTWGVPTVSSDQHLIGTSAWWVLAEVQSYIQNL